MDMQEFKVGQMGPLTMELAALEHLKNQYLHLNLQVTKT